MAKARRNGIKRREARSGVALRYICLGILCGILGCADAKNPRPAVFNHSPLRAESARNFIPAAISEIVILPLQPNGIVGPSANPEVTTSATTLTPALVEAFDAFTTYRIANVERADAVKHAVDSIATRALSNAERAKEIGRISGADAVLVSELNRFVDSDGSRFGAANPSAVGFHLWLLDGRSGQLLWSASYDRQEESLSDNLYRLPEAVKGGLGFKSATAVARVGFNDAARELERARLTAPDKTVR